MENKKTTNKIPTVRELITQELKSIIIGTGKISNITIESDLGKKIIENICIKHLDFHLTKQPEFIAKKVRAYSFSHHEAWLNSAIVDEQSIINAGEEYKNSVK